MSDDGPGECSATLSGWHCMRPRSLPPGSDGKPRSVISCRCGLEAEDQRAAAREVRSIYRRMYPRRLVPRGATAVGAVVATVFAAGCYGLFTVAAVMSFGLGDYGAFAVALVGLAATGMLSSGAGRPAAASRHRHWRWPE